jgi:hypothetical protein
LWAPESKPVNYATFSKSYVTIKGGVGAILPASKK